MYVPKQEKQVTGSVFKVGGPGADKYIHTDRICLAPKFRPKAGYYGGGSDDDDQDSDASDNGEPVPHTSAQGPTCIYQRRGIKRKLTIEQDNNDCGADEKDENDDSDC